MSELPAFHDPDDYCEGTNSLYEESQQALRYERARADAAMARLRVAVDALRFEHHKVLNCGKEKLSHEEGNRLSRLGIALKAIGELPPE